MNIAKSENRKSVLVGEVLPVVLQTSEGMEKKFPHPTQLFPTQLAWDAPLPFCRKCAPATGSLLGSVDS